MTLGEKARNIYSVRTASANTFVQEEYTQKELRSMLEAEGKTFDAFRQDVIDRICEFVKEHKEKIEGCIIGIRDKYVQVTFARRQVRYDADLQDASTDFEWSLAHEYGWPNVNTFLCPATSKENLEYMHSIAASGED